MALTEFQRGILRLLAATRRKHESFVAGGVALNTLLGADRRSRDIDLFHDTTEALVRTVASDRETLADNGYALTFLRETPTFAEAIVAGESQSTLIQWLRDSAFRFFLLVTDDILGLALHPFDLATNKVLAMAGRLEARDFIDLVTCCERVQPLGYLVWAACGKDPGYGPASLMQEIRRGSRYSQAELDLLDFDGEPPDARTLGATWHRMLTEAEAVCDLLPAERVGTAVVAADGELCRSAPDDLKEAIEAGGLTFHEGRIGGAWPQFPGA